MAFDFKVRKLDWSDAARIAAAEARHGRGISGGGNIAEQPEDWRDDMKPKVTSKARLQPLGSFDHSAVFSGYIPRAKASETLKNMDLQQQSMWNLSNTKVGRFEALSGRIRVRANNPQLNNRQRGALLGVATKLRTRADMWKVNRDTIAKGPKIPGFSEFVEDIVPDEELKDLDSIEGLDLEALLAEVSQEEGIDIAELKDLIGMSSLNAEELKYVERAVLKLKGHYPFPQCVQDRLDDGYDEESATRICAAIRWKSKGLM